jgi:hypothetical protein
MRTSHLNSTCQLEDVSSLAHVKPRILQCTGDAMTFIFTRLNPTLFDKSNTIPIAAPSGDGVLAIMS